MRGGLGRHISPIIVGVEFALFGDALASGASSWRVALFAFLSVYTLMVTIQALFYEQDVRRIRFEREMEFARMFPRAVDAMRRTSLYVPPMPSTPTGGTHHDA